MKAGDLVRLNSGGPILVVSGIDGDNISVRWFDGAKLQETIMPPTCLMLVDANSVSPVRNKQHKPKKQEKKSAANQEATKNENSVGSDR